MRGSVCWAASCVVVLGTCGCVSESGEWDQAAKRDTPGAYRAFLQKYPASKRTADAERRVTQLEFERVRKGGKPEALREFARSHPGSPEADAALRTAEELDWKAAEKGASPASFEQFITRNPSSARIVEARSRIEGLDWKASERRDTSSAYWEFFKKHPQSAHAAQALERWDDRAWTEAVKNGSSKAKREYLVAFPTGRHADAAAWGIVISEATREAFERYLREHPKGPYADKAARSLEMIGQAAPLELQKSLDSTKTSLVQAMVGGADRLHGFHAANPMNLQLGGEDGWLVIQGSTPPHRLRKATVQVWTQEVADASGKPDELMAKWVPGSECESEGILYSLTDDGWRVKGVIGKEP